MFRSWLLAFALLAGCKGALSPSEIKGTVQVIVDEDGFKPDHIPALVGKPLTLVITRKVEKTCANTIVIAQENIRRDLPLNSPVMVTFIPEKPGNIHFACPMNMYTGEVAVQELPSSDSPTKGKAKAKLPAGLPKIPGAPAPPAIPAPPAAK